MGSNQLERPVDGKKTTRVLVTGFGPFTNHAVNASWVAVQELVHCDWSALGAEIFIEEIPVRYCTVDTRVPQLWAKLKPDLVVHVGVSGLANKITIEQCANSHNYRSPDIDGNLPGTIRHPSCLHTGLDVKAVADVVNLSGVHAVLSTDCGRYLCEYIYHTSLSHNHRCTLFIHVPPIDRPYTIKELVAGLRAALENLIQQVQQQK